MVKKQANPTPTQLSNHHRPIQKHRQPFQEVNHHSPPSRSSETGVNFQEHEEVQDLTSFGSFQMRKAEALLSLNGTDEVLEFKYRDKELQEIREFVWEVQTSSKKGCRFLMVTGSPGLGKTLSVTKVLRESQCTVISFNGNITKTLKEVQQTIYERLTNRKANRLLTTQQLIRHLLTCSSNPIIVYIQEIEVPLNGYVDDYTCEFLSLFTKKELNIGLIGVSNTIDALQKFNAKVYSSLYEIKNLVFSPYSQDVISLIIQDKLNETKQRFNFAFEISQKLLKYAARKLQNFTKGDMRMVNEFIKELIDEILVSFERASPIYQEQDASEDMAFEIQIKDLERIFKKMENPKLDLIKSLPFSLQLLLTGISHIISKEELLYLTEDRVIYAMGTACEAVGLSHSKSKIREWLKELKTYGMVKVEERKDREVRVMLAINSQEIKGCARDKEKYLPCFLSKPKAN